MAFNRRYTRHEGARRVRALCLFLVPCVVLSAAAQAQQNDPQARLNRLENEIQTLSQAVFKGEAPGSFTFQDNGKSAQFEVRLTQLENDVRAMTGRVEEIGYQINQIQKRLDTIEAEKATARDQALEALSQKTSRLGGEGQGGPIPVTPDDRYVGGAQPQPFVPASDEGVTPPPPENAQQLGTLDMTPGGAAGGPVDSADEYAQAFSHLKAGKYDEAEKSLTAFIAAHPDDPLVANAQYWLGETFYVRKDYERAARIFAEGYQKYQNGPKAADNLLKLALSLAGMGKKDDACLALGQIKKEYPAGSNPVLARADLEAASLGCK